MRTTGRLPTSRRSFEGDRSGASDRGLVADLRLCIGDLDLSVALTLEPGQTLAVLGPNGAGKTTLLRALAGLNRVDSGRIVLGGTVLLDTDTRLDISASQRSIGFMFQDYLLFPHLSVLENVAFGPRSSGRSRSDSRALARKWIKRVGLEQFAQSLPGALSGGQAQRIALARSLVGRPELLLLDEPLAALDASSRPATRRELRLHLGEFEGVTVLVTHDPLDALTLADRVLVLENGRVTQQGTVDEVTSRPRTTYVAELLGVNLLAGVSKGSMVDCAGGIVSTGESVHGDVLVLIRPQSIALHRDEPQTSARNVWPMTISHVETIGEHVRVALSGTLNLVAEVTSVSARELALEEGARVWASVKATEVVIYEA